MMTIYGMANSGNCYKPRLVAALLGLPFRHVEVSFLDGGTQSAGFREKNPIGKVPLLELEDGRRLPESNAMLCYLAERSPLLPLDPFERATALSWMFFEQYSHEPNVAVRRSLLRYAAMRGDATQQRLEETLAAGNHALGVMEGRLATADWLAGDSATVADIALYAYTHTAGEGGFNLAAYPGIRRWLASVEALPGYVPQSWLPE